MKPHLSWPFLLAVGVTLAAALPSHSNAQVTPSAERLAVSDTAYALRLNDGSTLIGRITEAGPERIVIVTATGVRVELARGQIRSADAVRGSLRDGEIWPADPNRTRLMFGPTGRALRRGEGYIGAFELFLPFVAYGITDRISIAGGTPIVPEVIGRVFYLAPKVTVLETAGISASTGVLAFFDFEDTDSDVVGILYGAGSWGSDDDALTAGAGWGFAGSDVTNRPVFLLGGEKRVSARVKLITENYLIAYDETVSRPGGAGTERETNFAGLFGAGVRFFGERLAGDLGLGLSLGGGDSFCCVPLVNFVYNFGPR